MKKPNGYLSASERHDLSAFADELELWAKMKLNSAKELSRIAKKQFISKKEIRSVIKAYGLLGLKAPYNITDKL